MYESLKNESFRHKYGSYLDQKFQDGLPCGESSADFSQLGNLTHVRRRGGSISPNGG